MGYPSLNACVVDLERSGRLVRVREEGVPHLEMAAIHLRVHERGGPALLFERPVLMDGSQSRIPVAINVDGIERRRR